MPVNRDALESSLVWPFSNLLTYVHAKNYFFMLRINTKLNFNHFCRGLLKKVLLELSWLEVVRGNKSINGFCLKQFLQLLTCRFFHEHQIFFLLFPRIEIIS
jgi:hypothetical protein